MMRHLRCLYWQWNLAADEAYLRVLKAEGWTDDELKHLRQSCEVLRVKLATCGPLPSQERVIYICCAVAAAALGVILLWPSLARIASSFVS